MVCPRRRRRAVCAVCLFAVTIVVLLKHKNLVVGNTTNVVNLGLNKDVSLRYIPPLQSNIKTFGKTFHIEDKYLNILDISSIREQFLTLTEEEAVHFVFATASTTDYLPVDYDAMATVQKHFPNHTIIFYDLENNSLPHYEVEKIRTLCNVVYRKFNYNKYPAHVHNLEGYFWKPLIIHDLLLEYPGVFWIDSSIRFISGDLGVVKREVVRNNGILTFMTTGHSNFAVTHSTMYDYLPTSLKQMKTMEQREANCLLIFRTQEVYENIILWWTLCALEPQCMASLAWRGCEVISWAEFAFCHRFDQSAINILMANYFSFDYFKYYASVRIGEVDRNTGGIQKKLVCPHQISSKEDNRTIIGILSIIIICLCIGFLTCRIQKIRLLLCLKSNTSSL